MAPRRVKGGGDDRCDPLSNLYREIVDALPMGVVVLAPTSDRAVMFANARAVEIFERQDGVHLTRKGLELNRPSENQRLSAAIKAHENATFRAGEESTRISVVRKSAKTSYLISIGSVMTGEADARATRAAILYLHEVGVSQKPTVSALRDVWNLTRSEANLVLALMDHGNLKEAARACKLTAGTARQYLKRIFTKVNVRGQVELIALLLRLPN